MGLDLAVVGGVIFGAAWGGLYTYQRGRPRKMYRARRRDERQCLHYEKGLLLASWRATQR